MEKYFDRLLELTKLRLRKMQLYRTVAILSAIFPASID